MQSELPQPEQSAPRERVPIGDVAMVEVLGALPLVLYRVDAGGVFLESRGGGLARLGLAEGEAVGRNVFAAFPQVSDHFRRAFSGETVRFVAEGQGPAGPWWFDAFVMPDRARGGAIGLSIDITERVEAERALRESEARLRGIMDHAADAVFLHDLEGRFVEVNPQACQSLGYTRDELLALTVPQVEIAAAPEDYAQIQAVLRKGGTFTWNGFHRRKDGTAFPVEVRLAMLPKGDRSLVLAIARNLTERCRQQEEQTLLRERMRQSQKMESLAMLAGGIAHDFNNLLTGVLGNASVAIEEIPENAPGRAALARIETSAIRAAELAQQMLAYSGRGRFDVRPVDLSGLVQEMASLLESTVARRARVVYRLAPDVPAVEADVTQMRQVVLNLLTNAAEAVAGRNGIITLATMRLRVDAGYIAETYLDDPLPAGCYVQFEVADDGPGMDAETRDRVFDPFFTTKATGRGLGLAAVLGIVRGHGGAIRVRSAPGKGTAFQVILPCTDRPVAPVPPPPHPDGEGSRPLTILVVDDEALVRDVACRILESQGHRVLTAEDGMKGIETLRERAGEIDVVLLDLTMPRMDGVQALREMRKLVPGIRIIVMSGFTEQDTASKFSDERPSAVLHKPFAVRDLLAAAAIAVGP